MDLTQQESEVLDQYAEQIRQGPRRLGPTPYATITVCGTSAVNSQGGGREEVARRLMAPDSELSPGVDDQNGEPVSMGVEIHGAVLDLELNWIRITGLQDHEMVVLVNNTDAFILVYDDTSGESLEALVKFNDAISSLPVLPPDADRPSTMHNLGALLKSTWQRLLGRNPSTSQQQGLLEMAATDMDPGPIPKLVVCNHSPGGPCVVSREEGEELARRLGAPFYMISAAIPGWGDRHILEQLLPRLMYRRACGVKKATAFGGALRSSFSSWSRFNTSG